MAQSQSHRGPAPMDDRLFRADQLPTLRAAVNDLCWLLDHGYASNSATELVGNRYNLAARQRMAVSRCVCSAGDAQQRRRLQLVPEAVRGRELWLDGYNVLTILESALAGGVVLLGRDGCCRDIAGIHRRYRKVNETVPGLRLVGETTAAWGVTCCRWWLDKPVSNSGRLKKLIHEQARAAGWNMAVELDRCQHWVNLTREIITERIQKAWLLDLAPME